MILQRIAAGAANFGARIRRGGFRPSPALMEVVHIFVLTAFAISQPVFDRVGERPGFLADMGVRAPAVVLFAATFGLALPSFLAAFVWGAGRLFPRARSSLLAVTILILFTATLAPLVNQVAFLTHWFVLGATIALGAVATWAYFRFQRIRSVISVAAPVIVVFPTIFLLASPVARHFFFPSQRIETARWNPVPVVFVVLDELCGMTLVNERREIDADRYPHFADLARRATWFRNASTVYPDTWQALPAILSGRYPSTSWAPTAADRPQNLFSILDATGAYRSTVFEPISRLASPPVERALQEDADVFSQMVSIMPAVGRVLLFHLTPGDLRSSLPDVPRLWFGFHDSATIDRRQRRGVFRYAHGADRLEQFDHFLNCLEDSQQPQLFFFHVLMPHIPWCYLPSGRKCIAETADWELLDEVLQGDELYVEQCQQRHLLQLSCVDAQIGRLLDRLRESGLYDKCLLIVTADHGVSFRVGNSRRAVGDENLLDILSVPLFIKTPGQESAAVSDKNVESIDILPTITELLGIDVRLPVDGVSVFGSSSPERHDKLMHTQDTLGRKPLRGPASIIDRSTVPQELRRRFGAGHEPEALFLTGPHSEIVGRQAVEFSAGTEAPVELDLIRSGSEYSQDRSTIVPCFIEGRVASPQIAKEPVSLAVAVNGVVRATTRTYSMNSRYERLVDRFAVMLPESAFREGANDVRYFALTNAEDPVRLTPCVVKPAAIK